MDYNVIRKEIDDALAAIGEKHGFNAKIGGITYNASGFNTSIHATVKEVNGKTGAQLEFETYAGKFGYQKDAFGRIIVSGGKSYRIIGVNPKARTIPLIVEEMETGNKYKMGVAAAGIARKIGALIVEEVK